MNCYLITNPSAGYVDIICGFVSKKNGAPKKGELIPKGMVLIDSEDKYSKESFDEAFKKADSEDTVFIVPELEWNNNTHPAYDAGYKIAYELLEGKLKGNPFFNLVFISCLPREELMNEVSAEYVDLVKAFPHLLLSDVAKNDPGLLSLPSYSDIHFELMRRVMVLSKGRLDFIKHRLSHIKDSDVSVAKTGINNILDLLSSSMFSVDTASEAAIREFRNLSKSASNEDDINKLVINLWQYIDDLIVKVSGKSGEANKYPYSVLIIEDEPFYRENLKEFFGKYFMSVEAYSNMDIESAPHRIAKDAGAYNVIILDMMYSVNGDDSAALLPFNGLDLLLSLRKAEVKKSSRRAAVRIVTALPRNDLSRLFKNYIKIESPTVFTKGNGWERLEGCIADRMDEIIKECKQNERRALQTKYCPKTGVFAKAGMIDAIESHPDIFKAACKYADNVFSKKWKFTDQTLVAPDTVNPDELLARLKATMAHRRLVMEYILQTEGENYGIFDETDYREYINDFITHADADSKGRTVTRYETKYLQSQLGFTVSPAPERYMAKRPRSRANDYVCVIDLETQKNFFKAEFDFSEKENPPSTVTGWIDFVEKKLYELEDELCESYKNNPGIGRRTKRGSRDVEGYREKLRKACDESGISSFLQKEKTLVSVTDLYKGVFKYVSDTRKDALIRNNLQGFFYNHFSLLEYPHRREVIKGYAKEFVKISDALTEMEDLPV